MMANEMRDRFVELMKTANVYDGYDCLLCEKPNDYCEYCWAEKLADHLIENGVVVPPMPFVAKHIAYCEHCGADMRKEGADNGDI
jgi:hypothetical protein